VGRFAVQKLAERGWEVIGVSSREARADLPRITWLKANLLDSSEARRVLRDAQPTHLLHLAWYVAPGRWATSSEHFAWLEASLGLARAFKESGGRRLVGAGTCLEYDWNYGYCSESRTPCASTTAYGACKHALHLATAAMADEAMTTAWGRIFFLYGPHEHPDRLIPAVIRALLDGRIARTSHGEQVRDYLYADDVAEVFVRLLESDFGGPVNVGSGRPVSLKSIIQRIAELLGRPELLALGAIPPSATDTPLVVADTTRLKATLNWQPAWDLERGLTASIDYWRREGAAALQESRG